MSDLSLNEKPETREEHRWSYWANLVSELLEWPRCTGMACEYIVCDLRDEGGNLEMVHILGHTTADIRKQIAKIIMDRK